MKTKREQLLQSLQDLAGSIKVPDVKLVVSEVENAQQKALSQSENGFEERVTLSNKLELAEQLEKENKVVEKEEEELEVDVYESRRIQKHISDFKTKGKLENFIKRQALRRWKEVAQFLTRKIEEEEVLNTSEEEAKLKIVRADLGKQIKESLNKQRDFLLKSNDIIKYPTQAQVSMKYDGSVSDIKKVSIAPGKELKRLIPFCNNIVMVTVQKDQK